MERERNEALVRALYGLLMILPQSEAFSTLHRRLAAIPPSLPPTAALKPVLHDSNIDFDKLLAHFESVQEEHKQQKRSQRIGSLIDREHSSLQDPTT